MVNLVIVVVFAAVCVIGMEYLAVNIGQGSPFSSDYTVKALFSNADGLAPAADVRASGVVVGKIADVTKDPNNPGESVVTMQISDYRSVPVYSNGFATVRPKTLLGEKFVDLTVGSSAGSPAGEQIPAGGYLPSSQTTTSVANDQIFNAFDSTTRANEQQALQALDTALAGRQSDVQSILPNLQTVISNLQPVAAVYEKDQPEVDAILVNLNTILGLTADERTQISSLLHSGNIALSALSVRDAALIRVLQESSNVAGALNSAAAPTIAAQQQSLAELGPALSGTNGLLNQLVGPQTACHNAPCGIDELFPGTLTGNINYPNDQLTVASPSGITVTNEWNSMFSNPVDAHQSGGSTHAALNLVLSEQCDTLTQQNAPVVGAGAPASMQGLIGQACVIHTGAPLAQTATVGNPFAETIALAEGWA